MNIANMWFVWDRLVNSLAAYLATVGVEMHRKADEPGDDPYEELMEDRRQRRKPGA